MLDLEGGCEDSNLPYTIARAFLPSTLCDKPKTKLAVTKYSPSVNNYAWFLNVHEVLKSTQQLISIEGQDRVYAAVGEFVFMTAAGLLCPTTRSRFALE